MKIDRRAFTKYVVAAGLGAVITAVGLTSTGLGVNPPSRSTPKERGELTVYSGRSQSLIGPLIERFKRGTGINVKVRYGQTAELAATILEEGKHSPADLYYAQDAGALGALSKEGRLLKISDFLLERIEPRLRSPKGEWIGISGRARTVDYNTKLVSKDELPDSVWGFTDPKWKGKIGWAPTNGSFQAFITAFRKLEGEAKTREWLLGIMANEPQVYPKNSPIVAALGRGEIYVGFVNNYYLHTFQAEEPAFPVAHHYTNGDAGSMINIAGLGIVDTTKNQELAERFIEYMLSEDAQRFFAAETYEYPLIENVSVMGPQEALADINTPEIDLSDLDDLKRTLDLLREVGALP